MSSDDQPHVLTPTLATADHSRGVSPLLILAGGKSERMGEPKGLMSFHGEVWLVEQLRRFREAGGTQAVVVLGFDSDEYFKALPWLSSARGKWESHEGIRVASVLNEKPELGPFSSFQAGAKFLQAEQRRSADAMFVLPVDVPVGDPEVWFSLTEALAGGVDAVMPAWLGQGGHPVGLAGAYVKQLLALKPDSPDARLDTQLHALPQGKLSRVSVLDVKVCMNINTPSELEKLF